MPHTVVALSDTHGFHRKLDIPNGDILIHAGDALGMGTLEELGELNEFLGKLPHRHKVIIAGNHDWCFEREPDRARSAVTNAIYLRDEAVEVDGLKIYGSPWQPWFLDWAFNLPRGEALAEKWAMIPEDTDVVVTHGPPYGICDRVHDGRQEGCHDLLDRVRRVRPKLHIFGHIHEAAGVVESQGTAFVNASIYGGLPEPVVLELTDGGVQVG